MTCEKSENQLSETSADEETRRATKVTNLAQRLTKINEIVVPESVRQERLFKKHKNWINPSVPAVSNWRISAFEERLHETETS